MYMGNANIVPRQPRVYLYHAYLVYMEAHGYKNTLSLREESNGDWLPKCDEPKAT